MTLQTDFKRGQCYIQTYSNNINYRQPEMQQEVQCPAIRKDLLCFPCLAISDKLYICLALQAEHIMINISLLILLTVVDYHQVIINLTPSIFGCTVNSICHEDFNHRICIIR